MVSLLLRRGAAPVVMAGAAFVLAACAGSVPPTYTIQSTGTGDTLNDGGYTPLPSYFPPAPVLPPVSTPPHPRVPAVPPPVTSPVSDPPPLRPVVPDPPPRQFLPPVTFLAPPADATDCTGWWRICHLY
jgi:hypothetical protein